MLPPVADTMFGRAEGGMRPAGKGGNGMRHDGQGAFLVDAKGTILGFDERMESLTGWAAVEVVGRSRDAATAGRPISAAGRPLIEGEIRPLGATAIVDLRLHCRDGRTLDVEAQASRSGALSDRITVNVLRVVAMTTEAASTAVAERTDIMTGLPTEEPFAERLAKTLEASALVGQPAAVIVADVDHLRKINDRFGRSAGDGVLLKLAGIIRASAREQDVVARLGEDTFAALLPGVGRGSARQVAARLRSTVERFRFFGVAETEGAPRVTLSIGAASYPADALSAKDLLSRAREAMEEARALGRNRVWCYMRRPRVPVRTPVYLDGSDPVLLGFTRDLSPSGLFVSTPSPIEIGMRCALSFPLPNTDGNVHVIGRVVRTVPVDEPVAPGVLRTPGMGIEFERFGEHERRAIESFLYENERHSLRPETGGAFSV